MNRATRTGRRARTTPATGRKLRFVGAFAAYFAAIWLLWNTPVVYPLKVFVVLLHEISHGMAAVATGGAIRSIEIGFDQGGACLCPGGNAFLTLSAGYLGSLAWGVALLLIATGPARRHRLAVMLFGGLIATVTLLYIRNAFGILFGAAAGLALILAARQMGAQINRGVLTVLGLTSCLYAILDIKSDILDRPELRSDAYMLAEITGIHTLVWGVLWIGVALAVTGLLARRLWRSA